jgi:putative flippase GtrA
LSTSVQLRRFLIVGSTTVLVDFATYTLCLALGLPIDPAKGLGFVAGTFFAYLANRFWTFDAAGTQGRFWHFLALYLTTLVINVGVNAAVVALVGVSTPGLGFAFVVATGVSASLNFVGMKFIVFRP